VPDVHEHHVDGVCLGQVGLVDAVRDGGGGGLVDEAQAVEAGGGGGGQHGVALLLGVEGGHGDAAVDDGDAALSLGDLLEVHQHHGHQLLGREGLVLVAEHHVDQDATVGSRGDREGQLGDVGLHLWVGPALADEPLELVHRVLGVHGDLGGAVRAHEAHLVAERDAAGRLALGLLVHEHVNAPLAGQRHARGVVAHIEADDGHGSRGGWVCP
jgi:hypothetical protein